MDLPQKILLFRRARRRPLAAAFYAGIMEVPRVASLQASHKYQLSIFAVGTL
jgi:hypothetical protein